MKIRRLLLRGFGCLRGEYHFAADRVNLVLEPNEKGKSTLAVAILAGLYGFPPGQRRSENRPVLDIDVHRPWGSEEYLVEMDVEAAGRVFTVRRNFARREERVYEWRTGKEITEEFQTGKDTLEFGLKLTGLDREDFARTAFLRQSEMRDVRNVAGITAALQRMATSQQGDVAAAEAIETLRDAIRQYRGRKIRRGKIESEIAEIDAEIEALSERIGGMEERRRQAEDRIIDLERTSREEGRVDFDLQRLEYLVLASGRKEDAARLEEEDRERRDLEDRETEFQSLRENADIPAEGLQRILEFKGRMHALSEEEQRLRGRSSSEIEEPLADLESQARSEEGLSALTPLLLSRFSEAESDLATAWKVRRDNRRALRALRRSQIASGVDADRLRRISGTFGSLASEDRRFLLTCGEEEMAARSAAADLERESERVSEALAEIEARTERSRTIRLTLSAAAIAAAIAAVGLFLSSQPRTWAYAAGAAAAVLLVIQMALKPGGASETRIASLRAEVDGISSTLAARQQEGAGIRDRLGAIARQHRFESGEALLREFRDAESHRETIVEQSSLERRLKESEEARAESASRILAVMTSASHRPRFGAATPRAARAFRLRAAAYRELLSRVEDLSERRAALQRQAAAIEEERASIRREVAALLTSAKLPAFDDLDEAAARLEEIQQRRERYETLKREVIPALVRRSMTHEGEPLRRAVEAADAVLRRLVQENPPLAELVIEKNHKEYAEERDRQRQTSRSLAERRLQLSADLSEVLREYRKEYPDTQRWLREWKELRDRAVAFRTAVEMACDVLESLSREAYAEWADVLNERSSETLALLGPAYDDIRFDEDLSFTIRDTVDGSRRGREDVEFRFSAGTRDQIYFAARLALAGYLSSGNVRLPLILDDPFASFDDHRFSRAMELLVDKTSRRHQVILLSCHEGLHRGWQERNAERFAERVRIMTLQTTSA